MANEMDNAKNKRRLFKLHDLDNYEIADGDPDVRGWDVTANDGQHIGKVDELIVDLDEKKVRYLDVKATDDVTLGDGERHLLIPIGAAQLDGNDDEVHLNGITKTLLEKYPVFKGGPITYDYEMTLRETLGGLRADKPDFVAKKGMEFYDDTLYNDQNFFNNRRDTRSDNPGANTNTNTPDANTTNPNTTDTTNNNPTV